MVHLEAASIEAAVSGASLPLSAAVGRRVVLITGVGEPELLAAQLRRAGADVELLAFPDHHAFSDAELARAAAAASRGDALAVCTLKDAVKLIAAVASRAPGRCGMFHSG